MEEAARRLGVSVSTVRRMIEAGKLVGEREVIGGMRERYRVRIHAPETPHEASAPEMATSTSKASIASDSTPAITERSLAIIDAVIRANAETMDRQAERIDRYSELLRQEQERRIRAETASEIHQARISELEAALIAARRSWWRKLWDVIR